MEWVQNRYDGDDIPVGGYIIEIDPTQDFDDEPEPFDDPGEWALY